MKNNQAELGVTEQESAAELRAEANAEIRGRRARFVFTYILLFLACLLISTCIWLAVNFFEDAKGTDGFRESAESAFSQLDQTA